MPATHAEIAGVAESAGQLGIQTDNVTSFTKTMIDMGEATNMSADTAATSMARFANITSMSQQDFDRLGSTIVDLGNNMATTEAEITQMSLRLAGAGSQVGMTESEIMSFAAALSSVGIEAQAGGSAFSKVMVQMQLAVESGSDALDDFAKVAGMTNDQFAQMFQNDPSAAIIAFVEGLGRAEEQGTSAIKVLDDMGISEVRLRDSLLRAAGASDVFKDAVERGNIAWEENSALTTEAETRYETLESQLGMLRNEVYDVAIEFGGPLVKALRDGLEVARPLIEHVAALAENFSNADEETQEMILKVIGLTAAAGPALSIIGRLSTGIGGLTTNTIGFLGQMAKRNTVKQMTAELVDGTLQITNFGEAAATASGAKGVAGMTSALGGLSSVAWPIVGVGGVLAVGYGAWKLWGEEAWNSAQRTKRWGTDVGEVTGEALTDIKHLTDESSGQFNLMAQGFDTDKSSMADNFVELGATIENHLINRVEGLQKLIEQIPESTNAVLGEMLTEEQEKAQRSLEIVQDNNERINQIRQDASNRGVEISTAESKIIQDLARESTQAYVETLDVSAKEKQTILDAMTGDVENATKEQAKLWIQSLGEQRRAAQENVTLNRKAQEEFLEELGYSLEGEFAQKYLEEWDKINQTTVDGFDSQMATILEKYPELQDEVFLANGQLIDATAEGADAMVAENERIVESARAMGNQLAKNAEKNAEQISWVSDEAVAGAETWNNIVLDEQTGEVKTNVREEILEAGKDATKWNHMRFQLHNADLDSNAKQMIGEAAVVNGWWDGMAWEDKQAVLQDEFTETIYKSLEESGKWNDMSVEEKTAVLYSDTPEKMTETLMYLGLWDEYETDIKEINADNYEFINKIRQSEEQMKIWQALDPDTKELLGENYDLMSAIFESEERFNLFKQIPDEEKSMLAENTDLLNKVTSSEEIYNRWINLPETYKNILANNSEALSPMIESEEVYNRWLGLPEDSKQMLASNTNLIPTVLDSEASYQRWLDLPDSEKFMRANASTNAHLVQPSIDNWNQAVNDTPTQTNSNASMSTNAPLPTDHVKNWIDAQNDTYSTSTSATMGTNAAGPTRQVSNWTDAQDRTFSTNTRATTSTNAGGNTRLVNNWSGALRRAPSRKRSVFETVYKTTSIGGGRGAGGGGGGGFRAKGTNYHTGGAMIVNDQKGSMFRELIQRPDGTSYIPHGRNVLLPNEPIGTKVYRASMTKKMFPDIPQYAEGVGIPSESTILQNMNRVNETINSQPVIVGNDNTNLETLLREVIHAINDKNYEPVIQMDKREVGRMIYDDIDNIMNKNYTRKDMMSMRGGGQAD